MKFKELAINKPEDLIFGKAPKSVKTKRGLEIGGGIVYPELNFTLPEMEITKSTMPKIITHYKQICTGALGRAVELNSNGVVLEFETLIEMTRYPEIGIEILTVMNDICEEFYHKHGLMSEIRLTPNDLREFDNPPKQRSSGYLDAMFELFEKGAENGGNLLSIESTGGKEISDDALMMCNMGQFIFSQSVLGVRDMRFLWKRIVDVANKTGVIPGGDTACGFGNTAMVLAEKKYIPKTFAAIARLATIARTLVCVEEGAKGPDKDCGYEGPFLKAITGIPISMEGKTAACAHLSPLGNIAAACADLWSNESVQNIKLLAEMAPVVYMEQLEYDTRLFNASIKQGNGAALQLQKLLVESDIHYDPQALILAPENVIAVSREIVKAENHVEATILACKKGLEIIKKAHDEESLFLSDLEIPYIDLLNQELDALPRNEIDLTEFIVPSLEKGKFIPEEYGL